jgi:acetyltransferase-like isoleucine patch superfamily enzyme
VLLLRGYWLWRRIINKAFTAGVSRSFAGFGRGSSIQLPADLLGIEHITVGERVLIHAGAIIQSQVGGTISIGDDSLVYERAVITAQLSVVIEAGAIIGRNAHVSDHTHTYDDPTLNIVDQREPIVAPVLIKEGAWIANGAIVMPGITVGKRAVVGANAVVTADVPDYAVAVGAPARIVRRYDKQPSVTDHS